MKGTAQRIHVTGVSGTGKSTLGRRLGDVLHIPVYDLDTIAQVGGVRGVQLPLHEREAAITEIAEEASWITEGVHIGWSDPLFARADLIIWLDNVTPGAAQRRVVGRFVSQALSEARRRHGRDRFFRVRDYARELGGLIAHLGRIGAQARPQGTVEDVETREAIASALQPHMERVIRCTDQAAIEAVVGYLQAAMPTDDP